MMRAKRPRSLHGGLGAHSRTRSMSDDNLGDDFLLHMDPSLMTERQQLAFLLRKTAHEQSGGDSPSSDSSDDEQATKRPKKRIQSAKSTPRNGARNDHAKPAASTPRARPAKAPVKHVEPEPTASKTSPRSAKTKQRLHVKTTSPPASDVEDHLADALASKASVRKPSPSSTSDIAHMGVFDDHLAQTDFWSLHCALCSASASQLDADEPLFLCQSCDKKYPTQRALGRV